MKTNCAWCGAVLVINCDHCGAPLADANYVGSTFDTGAMVCLNGLTPIIYSHRAIDAMQTSHGMCQQCESLPAEIRDKLLAGRRQHDTGLPSAADLDVICAERERAAKHEPETRRANRPFTLSREAHNPDAYMEQAPKKRGPTEVPAAPTPSKKSKGRKP